MSKATTSKSKGSKGKGKQSKKGKKGKAGTSEELELPPDTVTSLGPSSSLTDHWHTPDFSSYMSTVPGISTLSSVDMSGAANYIPSLHGL